MPFPLSTGYGLIVRSASQGRDPRDNPDLLEAVPMHAGGKSCSPEPRFPLVPPRSISHPFPRLRSGRRSAIAALQAGGVALPPGTQRDAPRGPGGSGRLPRVSAPTGSDSGAAFARRSLGRAYAKTPVPLAPRASIPGCGCHHRLGRLGGGQHTVDI
jgi:hypothetical protein